MSYVPESSNDPMPKEHLCELVLQGNACPAKKQMGVDMTQVIVTRDESDITMVELKSFVDRFLDLMDDFKWDCGGGFCLVDVNGPEDDAQREMLVTLGLAHEALQQGEYNRAAEIIGQKLARVLQGRDVKGTELTNEALDDTLRGLRGTG